MYRDCPSKTKRQLLDTGADPTVLFHGPLHRLNPDSSSAPGFYNRIIIGFIERFNYAKRAVNKSFLRIILCEHYRRADLKMKYFWRKTAFFECGDGRGRTMREHDKFF